MCELLGLTSATLDALLAAPAVPATGGAKARSSPENGLLHCEITSLYQGERITRAVAEGMARDAGLKVLDNVTRKLDILVVADPDTMSGKAKKARENGTRIMAQAASWKAIGAAVV